MDELPLERREEIAKALNDRGAKLPCPRCGNQQFTLLTGGYFLNTYQPELATTRFGGPAVPTAAVACTRCGWIAEHALGVLGLLPPQPSTSSKDGA